MGNIHEFWKYSRNVSLSITIPNPECRASPSSKCKPDLNYVKKYKFNLTHKVSLNYKMTILPSRSLIGKPHNDVQFEAATKMSRSASAGGRMSFFIVADTRALNAEYLL